MGNNQKPLDRWLSGGSIAVGIIFFLLPKTPLVIALALLVVFLLLLHPLWNFWWIEERTWRRLSATALLAIALALLGILVWPPGAPQIRISERTPQVIPIPGDRFFMGSQDYDVNPEHAHEGPQHWVTVPSFQMGLYEITQSQWEYVAGLKKVRIVLPTNPSSIQGLDLPVGNVTWEEAVEFCERLSAKTHKSYRLPTEVEWEYACRAGIPEPPNIDEVAWYNHNSGSRCHPVGDEKKPNGFGLYDMQGNMFEWCLDTWHVDYNGAPEDGSAWEGGNTTDHVVRGGSYLSPANFIRSTYRGERTDTDVDFGFRVVLTDR